ncbi:MAG: ComF family protein [Pseudomonadota bacterium]
MAADGIISPLLRTVLPAQCPVTGDIVMEHGTLSPAAWQDLALISTGARCSRCGAEVPGAHAAPDLICERCHRTDHPWSRGAAAMRYEGTGRSLVLALKHGDRLDLAPLLARWMWQAGRHLVEEADVIVPVPLHWRRLLARRCNQSAELARAVSRIGGRPDAFAPTLLRRLRATPSQGGRDREARAANVADAFALGRGAEPRIHGRAVLLIDDVLTTGATLGACARLCHAAGAARVDVLVAALVTPDPRAYLSADPDTEGEHADGTG